MLGRVVAVAALSSCLVFGLTRGRARRPLDRGPRSSFVGAVGGGRLVGQHTTFAVELGIGRITARASDARESVAFDLAAVVDGTARPLALGRFEPRPGKDGLTSQFTVDFDDGKVDAELVVALEPEDDRLLLELRVKDPEHLGAHTVGLGVDFATEGRPLFVSGKGDVADGVETQGGVVLLDEEPHPLAFTSLRGALDVVARLDLGHRAVGLVHFGSEAEKNAAVRDAGAPDAGPTHEPPSDEDEGDAGAPEANETSSVDDAGAAPAPIGGRPPDARPRLHVALASPRITREAPAASDVRVVLGRSTQSVWGALARGAGVPSAEIHGVVTGARGASRIFGLDAEGAPRVRATVSADGRFSLVVPKSVTEWYAALDPARTSAPVTFEPGTPFDLHLDVSPGGELHARVVDADTGRPITARLVVHGIDGTLDPSFGPDFRASGAGPLIDALRGEITTPLPVGRYRVAATKGIEWSVDAKVIEIASGRSVSVDLAPRHVVATPGVVGCDLHVHARPSFDTPVSVEDRVLSLAAAGVDFAVPTEHNLVGDYTSALGTLELGGEVASVPGVEVTTFSPRLGHFGVFPYPLDKKVPPFKHTSVAAVFNAARRGDPNRVLVVHHPRLVNGIGYFELMHFHPATDKMPLRMRTDFDAIEIYNGYEMASQERVDLVLRDYFALLNLGFHYAATGSSDSHRIQYQWAGYPRTLVDVGASADGPADALDVGAVVLAVKHGRAEVTTGPVVELEARGPGLAGSAAPGGELHTSASEITAHVRVRVAPWIDLTSIEIVAGGHVVRTFPLPSQPTKLGPEAGTLAEARARTVRFDQDVVVPVAEAGNTWILVVARGTRKLDDVLPFMPLAPMAITNPVWIVRPGR